MKKVLSLLLVFSLIVSFTAFASETENPLTSPMKSVTIGQMTLDVPESAIAEIDGTTTSYKLDEMGMAQISVGVMSTINMPEDEQIKYNYSPDMSDDELLDAIAESITPSESSSDTTEIKFDEPSRLEIAGRKAIKIASSPNQMAKATVYMIANGETLHTLAFVFVTFMMPDTSALDEFQELVLASVSFDDNLPVPDYIEATKAEETPESSVDSDPTGLVTPINDIAITGNTGLDITLVDYDGYKVTLTGYEIDMGDLKLNVIVENNSDIELALATEDVYVNGWLASAGSVYSINSGKKSKDYISVYDLEKSDVFSIDDLEEIEIVFYVYDSNYDRQYETDTLTLRFK